MTTRKDEFSEGPVECPTCKKTATSVFKTGDKIFYNHGNATVTWKDGKLGLSWQACEADRS